MPICHGPVISKKLPKTQETKETASQMTQLSFCFLCCKTIEDKPLKCLNPSCDLRSHIICLSKTFLHTGDYIPVDGKCPKCKKELLWGDIIRKYKGCYENFDLNVNVADDFYSSDSE